MPFVDPKPKNRPFRRVLYREDSKDPTVTKDVTPRVGGQLITEKSKKTSSKDKDAEWLRHLTKASTKLLMSEGALYQPPGDKIKYIKRFPNDPMSRYLFRMNRYANISRLTTHSLPDQRPTQ